jgi:hypothetical protein
MMTDLHRPLQAMKVMILSLGYHALIDKTIHFDSIPADFYPMLAKAYPPSRLERFGPMQQYTEQALDRPSYFGVRAVLVDSTVENSAGEWIYHLSEIKRLVSEGFSEADIFDKKDSIIKAQTSDEAPKDTVRLAKP